MSKMFNTAVFKKGSPILWIVGAIGVFVIFYLMASGGGSSEGDGSVSYIDGGMSDAQLAQQGQLAALQLQNNAEIAAVNSNVAMAQIGAGRDMYQIDAERAVALVALQNDTATQLAGLNLQKEIAQMNKDGNLEAAEIAAEFNIAGMRLQNEGQIGLANINKDMFNKQLDSNVKMLQIQSNNMISQSLIAQASSLKKKDRDNYLAGLAGTAYRSNPGSGDGLLNVISQPV